MDDTSTVSVNHDKKGLVSGLNVSMQLAGTPEKPFWEFSFDFLIKGDEKENPQKVSFEVLHECTIAPYQGMYKLAEVELTAAVLFDKNNLARFRGGRKLRLEKWENQAWIKSDAPITEIFTQPEKVEVYIKPKFEDIEGMGFPFASLVPVAPNTYSFTTRDQHGPGSSGDHTYTIKFRDSVNFSNVFFGNGVHTFSSASDRTNLTGTLTVSGLQGNAEYFESWICWDPTPQDPCSF